MKTPDSIIRHAKSLVETAQFGLLDMRDVPGRTRSGLQAAVMAGRSVTFALQNLSSLDATFKDWWAGKVAEMKADPILTNFSNLRTKIEKQGTSGIVNYAVINNYTAGVNPTNAKPPEGAVAFFAGDETGGSGWITLDKDGAQKKHYIPSKQEAFRSGLKLRGEKDFEDMLGEDAEDLIEHYVAYLEKLVLEAEARFGSSPSW